MPSGPSRCSPGCPDRRAPTAGPGWGWRSRGGSSSATAGACGSSRTRAVAASSGSACRYRKTPGFVLAFLIRRLLSVVAVMVGVVAFVFSVFYAFRPELVSDGTGYPHQLLHYLNRVFLHFDLGTSSQRQLSFQPVAPLLRQSFPAELSLVVGGLVVGAAMGVALGALATQWRGTLLARGLDGFAAFGMSAPVYWVGAMTVVFFHPEGGEIARLPISKPNTYQPLTHDPLARLQSLWLPWIILGLPLAAIVMR